MSEINVIFLKVEILMDITFTQNQTGNVIMSALSVDFDSVYTH